MSTTGRVVAGPSPGRPRRRVTAFLSARRLPCVIRTMPRPYSLFAVDEHGTSRAADWMLVFDSDCSDWPEQRRALAGELAGHRLAGTRAPRRPAERRGPAGRGADPADRLRCQTGGDRFAPRADRARRRRQLYRGSRGRRGYIAARELRALLREILYGQAPAAGVVDGEAIALIPADDTVLDRHRPGPGNPRARPGRCPALDRGQRRRRRRGPARRGRGGPLRPAHGRRARAGRRPGRP